MRNCNIYFALIVAVASILLPGRLYGWSDSTSLSSAGSQPAETEHQRTIRESFEKLVRNRDAYNNRNDSIYIIQECDDWIDFLHRRAVENREMYEENSRIFDDVREIFENERIEKSPEDYEALRRGLWTLISNNLYDPFTEISFCQFLADYYQSGKCPDELNYITDAYSNLAYDYYNISLMLNDTALAKRAYEYSKLSCDPKLKGLPSYDKIRFAQMGNWMTLSYYLAGVQGMDEVKETVEYCRGLSPADTLKMEKEARGNYMYMLKTADKFYEDLIRNVYMTDSTIIPKRKADSLMRVVVDKNLKQENLDFTTRIRTYYMQAWLKEITYGEAADLAITEYKKLWDELYSYGPISSPKLTQYMRPLFTLFSILNKADKPYEIKHDWVKRICSNVEDVYSRRTSQHTDMSYVRYLIQLATSINMMKHLTAKERINFLNTMYAKTQVTTYAHSVHVGAIARYLTESIIKYQPEMLIGMPECNTVRDVRRNRHKLSELMYNASLYHDLGKISIIPVVYNDFRPMYGKEYDIISHHSEIALKYLAMIPELAKYRDFALGHHKWYNGKLGYPQWYDNTKSEYKTLVDIFTVCECLQAATECIGRNYREQKGFYEVMKEFNQDAGSRYNPNVINFINSHPDVQEELKEISENHWREVYSEIFREYFQTDEESDRD